MPTATPSFPLRPEATPSTSRSSISRARRFHEWDERGLPLSIPLERPRLNAYHNFRAFPEATMQELDRITQEPGVMGGKACIRGMRVTVGMIVGQVGAGHSVEEILN